MIKKYFKRPNLNKEKIDSLNLPSWDERRVKQIKSFVKNNKIHEANTIITLANGKTIIIKEYDILDYDSDTAFFRIYNQQGQLETLFSFHAIISAEADKVIK